MAGLIIVALGGDASTGYAQEIQAPVVSEGNDGLTADRQVRQRVPWGFPRLRPSSIDNASHTSADAEGTNAQITGGDRSTAVHSEADRQRDNIEIDADASGSEVTEPVVRISWSTPRPFAAYRRAGRAWLVLKGTDAELSLSSPSREGDVGPPLQHSIVSIDGGQLIGIDSLPEEGLAISWDESGIAFWDDADRLPSTMPVSQTPAISLGDALQLPLQGEVIGYLDPVVGDRLQALLTLTPSQNSTELELYDLAFVPSIHSYVWKPSEDFNQTRALNDITEIERRALELAFAEALDAIPSDQDATGPSATLGSDGERLALDEFDEGLDRPADNDPGEPGRISANQEGPDSSVDSEIDTLTPRPATSQFGQSTGALLGIARLDNQHADYWSKRTEFVATLAEASDAQKVAARLELARLAIAQGLGAEALSALAPLLAEPSDGPSLAPLAAQAAALVLMGRSDEALPILQRDELESDLELSLWRLVAAWDLGDRETAARNTESVEDVIADYPGPVLQRIGPQVVRALASLEKLDQAWRVLSAWPDDTDANARGNKKHLLAAELLREEDQLSEAANSFGQAMDGAGWSAYVSARFQRSLIDLSQGLSLGEIVDDVEKQRLLWRGHEDEIPMLLQLAHLHDDLDDDEAVLETLDTARQRLNLAPNQTVDRGDIDERIQQALQSALHDAARDEPLRTLELLHCYRDILDEIEGEEKFDLVLDVAQALGNDGFENAAIRIVEAIQVENHERRGEILRFVADLHDLAGRPTNAISTFADIPADKRSQDDDIFLAQAYFAAGELDRAHELVRNKAGYAATALEGDILFRQRNWANLALMDRRDAAEEPAAALPGEGRFVLQQVIAQSSLGGPENGAAASYRSPDSLEGKAVLALTSHGPAPSAPEGVLDYATQRYDVLNDFLEKLN